jgi:hypothetical protein
LLYKYTENRKKEKFESYLDCYYWTLSKAILIMPVPLRLEFLMNRILIYILILPFFITFLKQFLGRLTMWAYNLGKGLLEKAYKTGQVETKMSVNTTSKRLLIYIFP